MKGGKAKTETKADSRLSVKKGSQRAGRKPAKRAGKDPNKPKRAPSAFFVFLEEFRKQFKEKHPENKSVAAVGKAAGEKWKSMSDAEKAPYVNKSNKRKAELQKSTSVSDKKQDSTKDEMEEESDKSKSEINDEDDESGEEEEED